MPVARGGCTTSRSRYAFWILRRVRADGFDRHRTTDAVDGSDGTVDGDTVECTVQTQLGGHAAAELRAGHARNRATPTRAGYRRRRRPFD